MTYHTPADIPAPRARLIARKVLSFRLLSTVFVLIALSIVPAKNASAALILESGGELIGATGVTVNGGLYDVMFVDGTCDAVFGNCFDDSNFTFAGSELYDAATALFEQVFSANDIYDTNPERTAGCDSISICHLYTLGAEHLGSNGDYRPWAITTNRSGNQADGRQGPFYSHLFSTFDTSTMDDKVYARWSLAVEVPEPTTAPLFLALLLILAHSQRRRSLLGAQVQ